MAGLASRRRRLNRRVTRGATTGQLIHIRVRVILELGRGHLRELPEVDRRDLVRPDNGER